ncbi:putative lipid II flippase FtsW [Cryobacterium sp. GrIS_2_6]|uniref:putative lipid II flippase FtsW n=1 Tax=Cryobacterium sp. GrIS_2_6 TaxID=3162785 RepID=UPI002E0C3CB4|nr:putative lipid II flippase FtsW [Cryobacterium psychrotolerans]MEC5150565.1 cell division protein FtsW [Cryobacterium psychrotolerans]
MRRTSERGPDAVERRTESPRFSLAPGSRRITTRITLRRLLHAESSNYYLLLGTTLFMVGFGLMMVLSASSVDSHTAGDSFFAVFWKQGASAMVGIPLMLIIARIPSAFWRKNARLLLIAACLLQLLVVATPLGTQVGGNRNWLRIGSFSLQPSEALKVALAIWISMFLVKRSTRITDWKYSLLPVVLVAGPAIGLVTIGGDLGTTIIMGGMLLGALFFAGTPLKQLALTLGTASVLAVLLAISRPSRLIRILAFLNPGAADPTDVGWQIQNGYYALASGGIFGVGLGNSRSKWGWLPAADTDFIFAIIGNELGLIGTVLVLVLFAVLALVFLRIIGTSTDRFAQIATAAIMAWIIGEAVVNIAVVLGLLPVLGVPLPFFSSGGTALVSSLAAIGIVLSFERESKRRHPDSQPEEKARPRTIPTDRGGARPNSQAPSPSLTKRRPERSKTL